MAVRKIPDKMIKETFDSCLRANLINNLPYETQKELVSCTIIEIENRITRKTGRKFRLNDSEKKQIQKSLRQMED
jgi:hypothetical protein